MSPSPVPAASIAAVATAVALLGGCAGAGAPGAATSTASAPAAATATASPALADCLVGSWTLPEDQLVAFYEAAASGIPELSFVPFGTLGLDLAADGRYTYRPAFGFVLTLDLGFGTLEPRAEVTGDVTGTWSTDRETLVLSQASSSLAVTAVLDGQALDVADATDALIEASPMLTPPGAVSCDDDGLTLPIDAGTGGIVDLAWTRVG